MRLPALISLLGLLSLSACGGHADGAPPQIVHDPSGAFDFEPEPEVETAAIPKAPALEAAALKGMSAASLTEILGRPAFTRRDAPAEIWQYRVKACTLDLFLYDGTVSHHAVRSQSPVAERDCLREITGR